MYRKHKIIKIAFIGLLLAVVFGLANNQLIRCEGEKQPSENFELQTANSGNSVQYEWNRTWGGVDVDDGWVVAVDSSKNIYLAGETMSYGVGEQDMVLVKYDGNGVQQWNRTWGGVNFDRCLGVAIDSSDNLYLAGFTYSFGAGDSDMVLVKYDGNGMQQWNRTWGGVGSEVCVGVAVDSSNNTYLSGYTNSSGAGFDDMLLVKYDLNGVQQWNCTWGGNNDDLAYEIALDSSDNIFVVGKTESFGAGGENIFLVNYDGNGVQQWNRTWGGDDDDAAYGIALDSADNIYISGKTESFGAGLRDFVLVKYDSSGIQQWNRTWGGGLPDYSNGVVTDLSGNVYLVGDTFSYALNPGSSDIALVKYDGNGVMQWYRTWGGDSWDLGKAVAIDSSGNVYIGGFTYSFGVGACDMVLIKYKAESTSTGISSYNLVIILGVLSISSFFLVKKIMSKKTKLSRLTAQIINFYSSR